MTDEEIQRRIAERLSQPGMLEELVRLIEDDGFVPVGEFTVQEEEEPGEGRA